MKKFLGKLGKGIAKGALVAGTIAAGATGYGPLIAQFIPGKKDDRIIGQATNVLQDIAGFTVQAEVMSQTLATPLDGPAKLAAVAPLVTPLLMAALGITDRKHIDDPAAFDAAVKQITSGVVDAINAIKADDIPDAA